MKMKLKFSIILLCLVSALIGVSAENDCLPTTKTLPYKTLPSNLIKRDSCEKMGGIVKTYRAGCAKQLTYQCIIPVKPTTTSTKVLPPKTTTTILPPKTTTTSTRILPPKTTTTSTRILPPKTTTTSTRVLPPKTTTTSTRVLSPKTTTTSTRVLPPKTTTTSKPVIPTTGTKCIPVVTTVTVKEKVTVTQRETITVTVKTNPTVVDDNQCAGEWSQCGGTGFNGPKCCKSGLTCKEISPYYSQCIKY
ncbi:hypothetical protein H8356DRAFT_1312733 [Neocallimastix lanati (nom. inval.)]|nr:hypothetical protein H8356DRAFT_1312733 [Neocallimastix sp. JGI-2020a]